EDHAKLTRALASGYLLTAHERPDAPTPRPGGAPMADQAAGIMPAVGSALGALPQAAQARSPDPHRAQPGCRARQHHWPAWRRGSSIGPATTALAMNPPAPNRSMTNPMTAPQRPTTRPKVSPTARTPTRAPKKACRRRRRQAIVKHPNVVPHRPGLPSAARRPHDNHS